LWYRFFYQIGFTPWEADPTQGPAADQISTLFDREEKDRPPAERQVLDLGCGTGIWSVALASRGWQVTGIDIVPKAIRRARARAHASGVAATFVEGDVAALRAVGIKSGFRFVLDIECFNHLSEKQRVAVGEEVTAVTAPDATMLMLVWAPGRRGPLPPGASRHDIERALPEWVVIAEDSYAATSTLPRPLRNVAPCFYRLRRRLPQAASR
jgi:SAM-dependent methyltransferase